MASIHNANLCRQSVHNTPGTGVIYFPSTSSPGYARFKDAFPTGADYVNYTIIDGDNREIGIGKFVTSPYLGAAPGGWLERTQVLETVVSTTYSKYDDETNNLTPITVSNSAYVICAPTTFSMTNHFPVWKILSATPVSLPSAAGGDFGAGSYLEDYAECWFDYSGSEKAVYKFRIPMDSSEEIDFYLRATFISADEDDIYPWFTVKYWEIPHVGLYSRADWVDKVMTNNSSLDSARIKSDTPILIMSDAVPVPVNLALGKSGYAVTMNFAPIQVNPGSLIVVEITRTDGPSPKGYDYNIGLLDLFGEYQAIQIGANNLKSVTDATTHIPYVTKRV